MHTELEWQTRSDAGDETGAAERYAYFMRPEPREELGPIMEVDDPYLGEKAKVRTMKVGMVRNAKPEDKKEVTVYLHPFPHIRIDSAKPLQGWYQSKYNIDEDENAHRPRPCFTEAVLTEPYGGYCLVGCAFCLPSGELVDTPLGPVAIEQLKTGDVVYGRTLTGTVEATVTGTANRFAEEGLVYLHLSDGGRIRLTANHPVYSTDRSCWVAAGDLKEGERLESLRNVRRSDPQQEVLPGVLVGCEPPEEEAVEDVQVRSGTTGAAPSRVRRMCAANSIREWQEDAGQAVSQQRQTEIGGDAGTDVGSRGREPSVNERTREGAEVAGVSSSKSGGRAERGIGLSVREARAVHRPERADIQHAVGVGEIDSCLPGPSGLRLGLRAVLNLSPVRSGVPAGLRSGLGHDYRGERLLPSRSTSEDGGCPGDGVSGDAVQSKEPEEPGHPYVVRVEVVPEGVRVYDVETTTENFYTSGVLIHNCYINSGMRGYRGTGLISVPLNYGEQIRTQLTRTRRAAAGYFSSFTDPFTPLEDYYHNTERAAEAFVEVGLPVFFLSRLRYPEWALELLKLNSHSYAQKSINTSDSDDWRLLSPGAMSLEDHFADIARLKEAGIYVSIQVNPIIPGVTSHGDIFRLFRKLKEVGADHVIVKFVEAGYSWAPTMVEKMVKRFGDRGRAFGALFNDNMGGQRSVDEAYRLKAHRLYSAEAAKLGLTYATCYEYRYERDEHGNVSSKTGISIGREFTTADQCHGHAVPVYTRGNADVPFQPVEECPPSGCLHCADENEGTPRCGDELAGEAWAVRAGDMKHPIGEGRGRVNGHASSQVIQLGIRK